MQPHPEVKPHHRDVRPLLRGKFPWAIQGLGKKVFLENLFTCSMREFLSNLSEHNLYLVPNIAENGCSALKYSIKFIK
jgi:hypothetical protein